MNDAQKKVLMTTAAVVAGMLLFAPYRVYGSGAYAGTIRDSGYAFLFELPYRATVDVPTLLAQWVGIALIGSLAYFIAKDRQP